MCDAVKSVCSERNISPCAWCILPRRKNQSYCVHTNVYCLQYIIMHSVTRIARMRIKRLKIEIYRHYRINLEDSNISRWVIIAFSIQAVPLVNAFADNMIISYPPMFIGRDCETPVTCRWTVEKCVNVSKAPSMGRLNATARWAWFLDLWLQSGCKRDWFIHGLINAIYLPA